MTWTLCVDAGPTENGHRTRGIGWYTRHLLDALRRERRLRSDIDACYLRRTPFDDDEWSRSGWRWSRRSRSADWTGVSADVSLRVADWWQLVDTAVAMPRDAWKCRPDVLLATDPQAVPHSSRFRTAAILYDVIPLVFPDFGGARGVARRLRYRHRLARLRRAERLIAISEATRRDAERLAGFDASRIRVVYPGVDHAIFSPAPMPSREEVTRRHGLDRPFFLYVGEADRRKNLAGLARAVLDVALRHDIVLAVAGVVRGQTVDVKKQIARTDVENRIRWLGYVSTDELRALYSAALALTFPTLYEGFGLTVLEAMACGTPVVTSAVSSLPEVAGDAALYVDPNSATELAAAMERIILDAPLRAQLRARGLERARSFTWSRSARAVLEVCEELAPSRAKS